MPEDRASSDEEGEGDEEEEEEGEEGGGGEADSTPTDVPSEQANDPQVCIIHNTQFIQLYSDVW